MRSSMARGFFARILIRFGQTKPMPRRRVLRGMAELLEDRRVLAGFIAVGTDAGVQAEVRIFADNDNNDTYETEATGVEAFAFSPFPSFTGGARVAMGDFNGDSNDELVVAAGPGGGPHVLVYELTSSGLPGAVLDSFFAFGTFNGGVFVAAGDFDGDGRDELVTAADAGAGPHVRIFSDTDRDGVLSDNQTDSFFAYAANVTAGVRVAMGNTDNDTGDELITAPGAGVSPHVIIWDDTDLDRAVSDNPVDDSFFAYGSFTGGVYVSAGPVENAGGNGAEVITSPGAGGGPHVKIFSDSDADGQVSDNPLFDEFFAYPGFTGGVRVAAGDTDISSFFVEVVTGPGSGGGPHIKIFDDSAADGGSLLSDNATAHEFFAYEGGYNRGVFLAFGKVNNSTFALTGLPAAIPENSTLTSNIFVPSSAGILRDVDVSLFIQHTFNGDLDVTLTHVVSGVSVVLFTDVGGTDEGFVIRLNDEAGTDIGTADNPTDGAISGTFNPEGAALLGAFDSLDASGEWRLIVTDDTAAGADIGTLFGWTLHFSHA